MRNTFRLKILVQRVVGFIGCSKKPKLGFSSQLKFMVSVSFAMLLTFMQISNYFQKHRWMLDCMTELQAEHCEAFHSPSKTAYLQREQEAHKLQATPYELPL